MRAAERASFPRLEGELRVDTAIVGGGITGITAAALLKQAGQRVALLESRRVAQGESGRTTAHLTQCLDARVADIVRDFGVGKAKLVWASGQVALARIERFISQGGIECGYRRVPGYLYTEREDGIEALEQEFEASRRIGIPLTLLRRESPLPFPVAAALRYDDQARFHPLDYLLSLARALPGDGCQVFEDSAALEVDDSPAPRVKTEAGVVHARDVIVATNAPINNRVLLQTKLAAYRTYAIAARVWEELPDGLYWDDEDPYHYVRTHSIDGAPFLIVGGEDHRTGQTDDMSERFERLAAWAAARFPVRSVMRRWSGQIIEPVDGLPYIGRNSFATHVWEATGYGGTGLTSGTLAAMLLSDAILGRDNPWLDLYEATRITPRASARDYVKENASFPAHFIVDRFKHEAGDVASLQRGCGGIFNVSGKHTAVFRDTEGELHALSPVCPHLYCHVRFNDAEKTWDCPCHGSRFDVDGRVLNGPAAQNLEKRAIVTEVGAEPRT